jgi:DNA-binding response OmpR family regulator
MRAALIFFSPTWRYGAPMRLLVVEDDVKMASLLKRGLEREGYAVDVAATGEDALWAGRRARRHDSGT